MKAKKHFGQHFLTHPSVAREIVGSLSLQTERVLEVGPGKGVLTSILYKRGFDMKAIEVDSEAIDYLKAVMPEIAPCIIQEDFLKVKLDQTFGGKSFSIIGNFPYNISTQILFKIVDYYQYIPEVVGMFQKEVAQRICSPSGNKTYGLISVWLQAFYGLEYLIDAPPEMFDPPPSVHSGVVRLKRHQTPLLQTDEERKQFLSLIKTAFNQRRKKLSNALKPLHKGTPIPYANKRAEELSGEQFLEILHTLQSA